ncbi:MAG: hypothetical protein AAF845_05565 [Bacteroidota bacterium]
MGSLDSTLTASERSSMEAERAAATAAEPAVWLRPTTRLDAEARESLRAGLRRSIRGEGTAEDFARNREHVRALSVDLNAQGEGRG